MSLADQCAFPRSSERLDNPGMTYRQWLVGMALQGIYGNPELVRPDVLTPEKGEMALKLFGELAEKAADAAIRAQEKL